MASVVDDGWWYALLIVRYAISNPRKRSKIIYKGVFAFDEDLHAKINTTKTHEMIFNFNKQKFRQSYFFNLPISDILNGEDHTVIIYVTTKKKRSTTRRLQFNKSW